MHRTENLLEAQRLIRQLLRVVGALEENLVLFPQKLVTSQYATPEEVPYETPPREHQVFECLPLQ
jgi:hypothetical protein